MKDLPTKLTLRLLAAVIAALSLTACPNSPPEPKADLPEITVHVLDRFDQPVPDLWLKVEREVHRFMSAQPSEVVANATTDEQGFATVQNLKADDWISVSTDDDCFSGYLELREGTTAYQLKLDHAAISSVSFREEVNPGHFESEASQVTSTLNKILAHFAKTKQTEFQSPSDYVAQKIITQAEADHLVKMGKRMTNTPNGINFSWGSNYARITTLDHPITWVSQRSD